AQKSPKVSIGREDDVIVAIPDKVSESPRSRNTAKKRSGFEQGNGLALLSKTKSQSHAQEAATDNGPALCCSTGGRSASSIVTRQRSAGHFGSAQDASRVRLG